MNDDYLNTFMYKGEWVLPSIDNYSPSYRDGFLTSEPSPSMPRIRGGYRNQPTPIFATYDLMTQEEVNVFFQFYYGALAGGQRRFVAKLDMGLGLLEYICQCIDVTLSEWTGYSGKVTMKLLAVFTDKITDLETYRIYGFDDPEDWALVDIAVNQELPVI